MPNANLSHFFSLPSLEVVRWYRVLHSRMIYLRCRKKSQSRPKCPHCGTKEKVYVHQHYTRKVRDADIRGLLPILIIELKRYRCHTCRKTFTDKLDEIKPRARLTGRMQSHIYWCCENFKDLKKVRRHTQCSYKTIYKRYYDQLELKQKERMNTPWSKSIGIDEHAFNTNKERGHRNFVTLVVDHNNKRPKELLPTRVAGELSHMLSHIPNRERVQNVTMDLSSTYRSFARDFFPNAKIIADHFHVVRLLHPTINRMRKQITGDKRKNPVRKLLLKNGTKLEFYKRKAIWKWLDDHPDLKAVYFAKEALHKLYRCKGYKRARQSLLNLLDWLALQKIKELQTLRKTLKNWMEEILNYFKTKLTNARTEGFNNVAKSMIKSSYGLQNFPNYRLRMLNV